MKRPTLEQRLQDIDHALDQVHLNSQFSPPLIDVLLAFGEELRMQLREQLSEQKAAAR